MDSYLEQIKEELGKYSGRAFWTGRSGCFANQPMGKNMFFTIPRDMAKVKFQNFVVKFLDVFVNNVSFLNVY